MPIFNELVIKYDPVKKNKKKRSISIRKQQFTTQCSINFSKL